MPSFAESLQHAIERHRAGDLDAAETIYRQLLQENPGHGDPWHLLGLIFHQRGQHEQAVEHIQHALKLSPGNGTFLCNLGSVESVRGNRELALQYYLASLRNTPYQPKAWYNYANALREAGQPVEAAEAYQRALQLQPDYAEAHTNLGVALRELGRFVEAIYHYQEAVRIKPQLAPAHFNLGNALKALGAQQQVAGDTAAVEHFHAAQSSYHRALQLDPRYADAYTNLGGLLKETGRFDDAIASYQQAIEAKPEFAEAHSNLAITYQDQGLLDKAQECLRRALELKPDFAEVHSNLAFLLNYDPRHSREQIFAAHRDWGRAHTDSIPPFETYPQSRDPQRRLRIGYVSPDMRSHPVGRFIEPVLTRHDRSTFEPFVYCDVENADAHTLRLRSLVSQWRNTQGRKDDELVTQIRADQIDILVDLAGHTSMNRLTAFARRPAPIQISYLGYPNTTGLTQIDYLITDSIVDPPDEPTEFTETLLRIEPCFSCYQPPIDAPEVNESPALRNGFITFGGLHNLAKLNADVLDLWAELLRRAPDSRLLLCRTTLCGSVRERFMAEFERRGIATDRLDLRHQYPPGQPHLAVYRDFDIALDVFPWSGHTTACEAVWMGLPVVTLLGNRHAGRMVASILHALARDEWIARTRDEYLATAKDLAADIPRLAGLRATLREQMASSTLCDGATFTAKLEALYRRLWHAWCQGSRVAE